MAFTNIVLIMLFSMTRLFLYCGSIMIYGLCFSGRKNLLRFKNYLGGIWLHYSPLEDNTVGPLTEHLIISFFFWVQKYNKCKYYI